MKIQWSALENVSDLDKALNQSHHNLVAIFKHSTRCGTSLHVKEKLEREAGLIVENLDFYYLDLIRFRALSNEIAERFKVVHQSPQIIILREEKVVFHTSHLAISSENINQNLAQLLNQ